MASGEAVSVCFTVELDGPALWSGSFGASNLTDLSRGEYEWLAVPRVLDLFRAQGVIATWFVPGATAQLFPDLVRMVASEGHEVAHHGWAHESSKRPEADNRRNLERGLEVLEHMTGMTPRGFREPGGHLENPMVLLLQEYGFAWDSSLGASDYEAYYVRAGDVIGGENGFVFGHEVDLLEMPSSWNLDDFPAFEFAWGINAGIRTPSHVLEIWSAEFDFMRQHHPTGVFGPALHSQVIGRGHRLLMLDRLIDHMKASGPVQFETVTNYMTRWKAANPNPEPTLRLLAHKRQAN